MKCLVIARGLGLVSALILLIAGSYSGTPAQADNGGNPGVSESPAVSKVSSSLSLNIKLKTQSLAYPDKALPGLAGLNPSSADPAILNYEKVFLYFNQPPTASQLADLNSEGVTAYPDSWIPPVGNHPTGFILAEMPVDKLDALSSKNYIVQMDTAEQEAQPQNDLARVAMGVDSVLSGGDTGVGVTVAVLDSGIDTSNPDFPALNSTNSKDYSNYPTLDDTITNTVNGHGTHVAGSLLGRGVNSPTYKGVASGASLVFLKVGNDTTSAASSAALTYAVEAAVDTYHAKIINLSYGEWSEYHDGSDAVSQAVDYATSQGAAVFVAAGNDADKGWHYSATAGASSLSAEIPLTVEAGTNFLVMNLVWSDGLTTHNGLSLKYYDAGHNLLASTNSSQSESSKSGVESILSDVNSAAPASSYYLRVQNNSVNSQFFHLYYMGSYVGETSTFSFSSPDPNYTIEGPAEADTAIAVGAYVTRDNWTNYKGSPYSFSPVQTVGQIASYSSLGPRVDAGAPPKPDIVAPGTAIISVRDPLYTPGGTIGGLPNDPSIIDNDGQNGSGPANYFIMGGTSMASPMAAGVGALVLSKNPTFSPSQIKSALETTAVDKGTAGFDSIYGWGLVNAVTAVNYSPNLAVATNAASSILATGATLHGTLTSTGGASSVTLNFEYGLTSGYGSVVTGNPPSLGGPGSFSAIISGLTSGQTYHYRAKANGGTVGIAYGADRTFTAANPSTGGRIAFTSERDGNPEIYVMNTDGTNQTRLTNSNGYDYQPAWSPDGTKIAFVSTRSGPYNIYVMNADGSDPVRLTAGSGAWNPTWSPDGTKIAFYCGQVYIMNPDGSNITPLTSSGSNMYPDWSINGKIVYVEDSGSFSGVYTMDSDGNNKTRISSGVNQVFNPRWSPDGTRILYVNAAYEMYAMNADGTGNTLIRTAMQDTPAWSPDGKTIAYASNYDGNWEICLMNSDGSNLIRLTNNAGTDNQPDWTPNVLPQIVFSVSPGETKAGSVFTIQPIVQLRDTLGNLLTNSNAPVILTITGGSGKTGAVLAGMTTLNAVNGVATFTGLSINLANPAGNQYTLTAASGAFPAATSSPFCVDHPGDANGDGTITMGDVTKVEREILTLDPLTCGADPNNDGQVNMGDVTKIERIILALDPTQG